MKLALFSCLATLAVAATNDRQNFIFVLMDDWGIGDVNAYGGGKAPGVTTRVQTPNIDALASAGTLFTDFHGSNPVCSPSRASFMTSRYPSELKIHTALSTNPKNNEKVGCTNFLPPSTPTVTQFMQSNGYFVGHYGKWHLGGTPDAPPPRAYGINDSATFNSHGDTPLGNTSEAYWAGKSSTIIIDHAIDAMRNASALGVPFYLNLWFHISHAQLDPTPEQLAVYKSVCRKMSSLQPICNQQIFWASQTDADTQVGRLMAALHELNLAKSTLVALSADNGPEEPMVFSNAMGSTGPFRGRKRSLYEGGTRLPFIVSQPGTVPEGRVDRDSLLGAVDWFPTVAAMANLTLPSSVTETLDGVDMSAALRGEGFTRPQPLLSEWRFGVAGPCWNAAPQLSARLGDYKLLMNVDESRVELYNMSRVYAGWSGFLLETRDIASANPEIVASLRTPLLAWQKTLPSGHYAGVEACDASFFNPAHASLAMGVALNDDIEDAELVF